jgi:hypothetical protein
VPLEGAVSIRKLPQAMHGMKPAAGGIVIINIATRKVRTERQRVFSSSKQTGGDT